MFAQLTAARYVSKYCATAKVHRSLVSPKVRASEVQKTKKAHHTHRGKQTMRHQIAFLTEFNNEEHRIAPLVVRVVEHADNARREVGELRQMIKVNVELHTHTHAHRDNESSPHTE